MNRIKDWIEVTNDGLITIVFATALVTIISASLMIVETSEHPCADYTDENLKMCLEHLKCESP